MTATPPAATIQRHHLGQFRPERFDVAGFALAQILIEGLVVIGHMPLRHHPGRKVWPTQLAVPRLSQGAVESACKTQGLQPLRNFLAALAPRHVQ